MAQQVKGSDVVTAVAWVTDVGWVQILTWGISTCHGHSQEKKKARISETNVWKREVDVTARGIPEVLTLLASFYLIIWVI